MNQVERKPCDGVEAETAAWDWLETKFGTEADDSVDRAYAADEMVDAFHAGTDWRFKRAADAKDKVAVPKEDASDPKVDDWRAFLDRHCDAGKEVSIATPSARITGDKGRENPAEGAPYGEGLIGRITELERDNALLRRALAYAQGQQLRLMDERTRYQVALIRIAEVDEGGLAEYTPQAMVAQARQALESHRG